MNMSKETGIIATLILTLMAVTSISVGSKVNMTEPPEMEEVFSIFTDHNTGCEYMKTAYFYSKFDKGHVKTGFELTPRMSSDGITQYGCKDVK